MCVQEKFNQKGTLCINMRGHEQPCAPLQFSFTQSLVCYYRFEGLVAAALRHGEDFELGRHHSGWVLQQLEVWLGFFLLLFLLLFVLLLFFTLLHLLRLRKRRCVLSEDHRLLQYFLCSHDCSSAVVSCDDQCRLGYKLSSVHINIAHMQYIQIVCVFLPHNFP